MQNVLEFFEFTGGVLASALTILVFFKLVIFPFFSKLEIQLTKDLFFRLINSGEIFFAKVVVHAPINIQIISFDFELKGSKKNTQETSYNCKAEKFGSVERNSINERSIASFYLPKNSPEFLLTQGESKELLIGCNIVGSKQKIKNSIESLQKDYFNISQQHSSRENEKNKKDFLEKLKKCSADILSNLKLESGDHTLLCKIVYKYKHSFKTIQKTATSKVKIKITDNSLNMYKDQREIEDFLCDYVMSSNNKQLQIRYPECRVD